MFQVLKWLELGFKPYQSPPSSTPTDGMKWGWTPGDPDLQPPAEVVLRGVSVQPRVRERDCRRSVPWLSLSGKNRGWGVEREADFSSHARWHDFSKNPYFPIFSLKQVWWLRININEHNNNNRTGSSIKWMWSPAVEIFTRCVLPVREILALNLDITSSCWADSRFRC